jgi:hypothetical protein
MLTSTFGNRSILTEASPSDRSPAARIGPRDSIHIRAVGINGRGRRNASADTTAEGLETTRTG